MAGFFPHTGKTSPGGFVPLPTVYVTGVLDSLVSDLGAGVNGWSLYDDVRGTTGTTYPIYPHLYSPYGILNDITYFTTNFGRLFTTASQQVQGYANQGFAWYTSISGFSGSKTPISVDLTTWYDAYYSSGWGVTTQDTATLDRNYTGVTAHVDPVYQKCTKYVVLQSSSSQKTFYVQVAQMIERTGTPVFFVRPFESWNSATHTGTNGGSMEHVRFFVDAVTNLQAKAQYIAWYLSGGVFALWTRGALEDYESSRWNPNVGTQVENFLYIGNLDTSGCYDGDTDALCYVNGDTTYSGLHCCPGLSLWTPSGSAVNTTAHQMYAAVQCLRTVTGSLLWGAPTAPGFVGMNPLNQYHVQPRGWWYGMDIIGAFADTQGRFYLRDIDLYHAGSQILPGVNEGRRGRMQYVKVPQSSPNTSELMTVGPMNDGSSYLILKTGPGWITSVYLAAVTSYSPNSASMGLSSYMATGWAFSAKGGRTFNSGSDSYGDSQASNLAANQGCVLTHIAMPII